MLITNLDEVTISQIIQIAEKVKTIKIVTPNVNRFLYLEEKLYLEYGIAIQVTSNKEKALRYAEVIINIDFDENRINEYEISQSAMLVNIGREIKTSNSRFKGQIFNYYKINYDKEILEDIKERVNFNDIVLYESMIYKRDTFSHIRRQLNNDNVRFIRTDRINLY